MTNSLAAMLQAHIGGSRSVDASGILLAIAEHLLDHPETIEEIAPGMTLVRRPLSSMEVTERMREASIQSRRQSAVKRHLKVLPHINELRAKNPGITLREIAKKLDDKGIRPARAEKWSAASVALVIKKAQPQ